MIIHSLDVMTRMKNISSMCIRDYILHISFKLIAKACPIKKHINSWYCHDFFPELFYLLFYEQIKLFTINPTVFSIISHIGLKPREMIYTTDWRHTIDLLNIFPNWNGLKGKWYHHPTPLKCRTRITISTC